MRVRRNRAFARGDGSPQPSSPPSWLPASYSQQLTAASAQVALPPRLIQGRLGLLVEKDRENQKRIGRHPRQSCRVIRRAAQGAAEPGVPSLLPPLLKQLVLEALKLGVLPCPERCGRPRGYLEPDLGPELSRHPLIVCLHIFAFL